MSLSLTTILVRGEIAFMAGRSPTGGLEVWLTDGTAEGTRRIVTDPAPSHAPPPMALFDERLCFAHEDSVFVTDPAFRDATRAASLFAGHRVVTGDQLFALSNDTIVRTSGEVGGFTSIGAPKLMNPDAATAFGSRVLLLADQQPWVTDGTTAGTIRLVDTTVINRRAAFQITADGSAFFAGVAPGSGRSERFVTDGTPSGTRDYDNVLAGSLGVTPQETHVAAIAAGRLYIQVDSPTFGREPFVVDLGALAEAVGTSCIADPGRRIEWTVDAAPTLGGRIRLDGRADGATAATLLFGQPAVVPFALPSTPGCALHFEPTTASAIGPFPVTGGAFSLALTIPNASVLRGAAFTLQPLFAPGSRPGSVDVGRGLRLQLGN